MAAALGVGDIASVSGDGIKGQSFILDFKDVQVERASIVDFRTKLNLKIPECAKIRPFIDASYITESKKRKFYHCHRGHQERHKIKQNHNRRPRIQSPALLYTPAASLYPTGRRPY